MIDLSAEIQAFEDAVYGKDVRAAMVNGAEKIQNAVNDAIEHQLISVDDTLTVEGAGADAKAVGEAFSARDVALEGITALTQQPYVIDSDGKWTTSSARHIAIDISGGDVVKVVANEDNSAVCAFLKSDNAASGVTADFCANAGGTTWTERKVISAGSSETYTAPSDCNVLYIAVKPATEQNLTPERIIVNNSDLSFSLRERVTELSNTIATLTQMDEVESANFDLKHLSYNENGYLILNSDTGNDTHKNFVYCKTNGSAITRFRFSAYTTRPYSQVRPFIQDSAGHKITFVILKANANCTAYVDDSFTTSVSGTKAVDISSLPDGAHAFDVVIIGTTVLIYINGVYTYRVNFSAYISGNISKVGYNYRAYGTSDQAAYKDVKTFSRRRFAHVSFDDQLDCLKDIEENAYASIFDSTYFSVLKAAHDTYGVKFTLELFYQDDAENPTFDLSDVPTSYRTEFVNNSGWLKFAYHGPDPTTKLNELTTEELLASFAGMYDEISRFAGRCCIDTTPRLSNFRCTKAQALALKSNGYITGYLTADDDRASNTGLTEAENAIAETHDIYTDFANGISYFRTGTRFDNGTAATVDAALEHILADEASRQNDSIYIIFAHSYTTELMTNKLNALCEWCISRGIPFGYPFEHVEY